MDEHDNIFESKAKMQTPKLLKRQGSLMPKAAARSRGLAASDIFTLKCKADSQSETSDNESQDEHTLDDNVNNDDADRDFQPHESNA